MPLPPYRYVFGLENSAKILFTYIKKYFLLLSISKYICRVKNDSNGSIFFLQIPISS